MNKKSGKGDKTLFWLFHYLSLKDKIKLGMVMLCIMITAFATVRGTLFIRVLIDNYITPMVQSRSLDFRPLFFAILKLAGIYACGTVAAYLSNRMMAVLAQSVQRNIRNELFFHTQLLPMKYFDTHSYGEIMSRFTNDIDTLRQMISQGLPQAFSFFITLIFVFFSMLYTSILLTIIVLVFSVLVLYITKKLTGNSRKYFIQQQISLGAVSGFAEEMLSGQKIIKIFGHEEKSKEEFLLLNENLRQNAEKANTFANILMPVLFNIGNLQYVLLAVVGGLCAVSGLAGITLGAIASFVQLSKSYSAQINQVSQQVNSVIMALAGTERIFTLMDEEIETDSGCVTLVRVREEGNLLSESGSVADAFAWKEGLSDGTCTYTKLDGNIAFSHVDFAYSEGNRILHDISFIVNAGEKAAFVGATGAGKTTITNLINRFYEVDAGTISYDGIDIRKIKKGDLRRSLSMVLQDTHLFTASVQENIRYGRLDATDDEVMSAAKLANADGFITRLPDGYDTILSDAGEGLSQGQRQLLSIARAAASNPPVMILDEATSNIDTRTELLVQSGMDSLMDGRTVLVIAHRLSTIANADEIMVMKAGRMVEQGNHHDLIAKQGNYHELYTGIYD